MQSEFLQLALSHKSLDNYFLRRSIEDALKSHLLQFEGTLLDVGCGQMPYKPLLMSPPSKVSRYIGLDFEHNPIHQNYPDITWQSGNIPLDEASIDCAICTEVLEHCPEPEAVMKEIFRVLKPSGLFFYTVPFLWPLHEAPYDEYRYTPFSLSRHLSASGFVDIELCPSGGWDASLAQMLGLWVRRRSMQGWIRLLLSYGMMPIIHLLISKDKKRSMQFQESSMITGIIGTAIKPENG